MSAYLAEGHALDDELEMFAMRRLEPSFSVRIADHLDDCAFCRGRLARAMVTVHDIRLALTDRHSHEA
ncbi:MAG TPA: hypothetical protein VIY49_17990 [Bryobacteraceae bacterium]